MIVVNLYPDYLKITDTSSQGRLLSYLKDRFVDNKNMEFTVNIKDIMQDTGLGLNALQRSKKVLMEKKFITYRVNGLPPKSYYTVNLDKINEALEKVK